MIRTNCTPSVEKCIDEDGAFNYPIEFLNSLHAASFSPHFLAPKIEPPIMLLRNLDAIEIV